jgi:short-subunit dehydrogenase
LGFARHSLPQSVGFLVVLTKRNEANASALAEAIREQGGECMIVNLDLVSQDSISGGVRLIRGDAGESTTDLKSIGRLQ